MEPTEENRRAWDAAHRLRPEGPGGLGIPDQIRELLPDVAGKHVLHLQCGTGESTAQLVELGALVSAVDLSAEALELARDRAPDVAYVHADVHDLPLELRRGRFDLVYTGGGVLPHLHDLDAWTSGVASALKPGGRLLLYDTHPVSSCVDPLGHWRDDYFDARDDTAERHWQLGEILAALTRSGLRLTRLEEFKTLYNWLQRDRRIPWDFALIAEKGTEG
ncbi:MAG: class I SAM-dependent methyltransferase [Actinomycetota bacterium]